jgi:hypothetical protein
MTDRGKQSLVRQARRWGAAFGVGAGGVVAAPVIGFATAADAHANGGRTSTLPSLTSVLKAPFFSTVQTSSSSEGFRHA